MFINWRGLAIPDNDSGLSAINLRVVRVLGAQFTAIPLVSQRSTLNDGEAAAKQSSNSCLDCSVPGRVTLDRLIAFGSAHY